MLFFLLPTAKLFGNDCAILYPLLDDTAYIAILPAIAICLVSVIDVRFNSQIN
ncbi:MAG: hypothetical protein V7K68_23440 [Nostoc sp.]|uniref:hypothetical protein n=1 Tax=Nostoc sp. TaxID=1180 RepID=UPI002FF60AD1